MTVEYSSPLPTSPRERARTARRQVLLEAAEEVFAQRGFSGATMAEIASRAGYSAANLYNVFENKEALFAEVLGTSAEQVLDFTRRAGTSGGTFEQNLDQLIDAVLNFVAEHRGFFVILTQSNPEFDWRRNSSTGDLDIGEEISRENARFFMHAIQDGAIPSADPAAYSCIFRGTINNYIGTWVREEGTIEQLWESAKDLRMLLKRSMGIAPQTH